jgi:hypothetical protein
VHKFEFITEVEPHSNVHYAQLLKNSNQKTSVLENKSPNEGFKMYLRAPAISCNRMPSTEYEENKKNFSRSTTFVQDYLGRPTSQLANDRLFSSVGKAVSGRKM